MERVGDDLGAQALGHAQKDQVAFAEAEVEAHFYHQGTSMIDSTPLLRFVHIIDRDLDEFLLPRT